MTVALEAIFLALFVLASQNRLARQSDNRAHLNLQIDLLAEREMTTVLRLLMVIAKHLETSKSGNSRTDPRPRDEDRYSHADEQAGRDSRTRSRARHREP